MEKWHSEGSSEQNGTWYSLLEYLVFSCIKVTKSKYPQICLNRRLLIPNITKFYGGFSDTNTNSTKYTLETPNNPKYKYFWLFGTPNCYALVILLQLFWIPAPFRDKGCHFGIFIVFCSYKLYYQEYLSAHRININIRQVN